MLLPQTYPLTLAVMIFALLCLGSWPNSFKLVGKFRFELYYFDFAVGMLVVAVLLAFTAGSSGYDGFSFIDDLMHAGKRQWFYAFLAGVIFNFANMLLTASMSVAGLAVAFPVAVGSAVIIGSLLSFVLGRAANPVLLVAGCLAIIIAIAADASAYGSLVVARHEALARAGKSRSTRRPGSLKAILLALSGGLFLALFPPLIQSSMASDIGLGPYSVGFFFAAAVFLSTFLFDIFFISLPVEGEPVDVGNYFRAHPRVHLWGLFGGALVALGSTAALVASTAPADARLSQPLTYQLRQAFPILAALWGLLAWREFRGTDARAKVLALVTLVLYAAGIVLLSLAPVFLAGA